MDKETGSRPESDIMIKKIFYHKETLFLLLIITSCFAYAVWYFNYFEIPSEDYIGNILPPALDYSKGIFFGKNTKVMPGYPLFIAAASHVLPNISGDLIYSSAIICNIILYLPYLFLIMFIYKRFFEQGQALLAFLFLGFNLNSVYMAVNAELEMLLTLTTALAIALSFSKSKFRYVLALAASAIKYDAIGIIPAVLYKKTGVTNKRKWVIAGILGLLSALAVIIALIVMHRNPLENTYVQETLRRGPSMHRFILDMILVTGGFPSWMVTRAYFSESMYIKLSLYGGVILSGACIISSLIAGLVLLIKKKNKDFGTILVFSGIFVLIHVLYQNSKSRYVLPILWILNFVMFYGLFNIIIPFFRKIIEKYRPHSGRILLLLLIIPANVIVALFYTFTGEIHLYYLLFIILFAGISGAVLAVFFCIKKPRACIAAGIVILSIGISTVFYGKIAMDHYSLRRIEFKNIGLWYRNNQKSNDVLLITETRVAQYFTGLPDRRFYVTDSLKSSTVPELIRELGRRKITLVFIDDFYIRRLTVKDKNATGKKADLLLELRDNYKRYSNFTLIKVFKTGDTTSYLLGFKP